MQTEPSVRELNQSHVFATIPHGTIAIFRDTPSARIIGVLHRTIVAHARTFADGIVHMHLVEPRTPNDPQPDEATRQALLRMIRETGTSVKGIAVVMPIAGFQGSAIRSLASGLVLLARAAMPVRIFANETEAETWAIEIMRRAGVTVAAGAFTTATCQLREALDRENQRA